MNLSSLLSFAVLVIGCIVATIVVYKHKDLPSRLLGLSLFSLNYNVFLIFLLESKYILYVPFFFRTAGISYYMIVPSFYLYIVFVLKKRNRLRWTDTVHALPALFYFIDYLPFFLSSSQYKLQIIDALLNRNQKTILNFAEGWIMPPKFHFLAPVILALVYIFFVARILFQYYRFSIEQNKKLGILRWLTTATTLYFLLEGTSLAIFLFIPSHQWLFTVINILLMYFTMSLILFSDPYLLYGRYFNATYSDKEAAKKHKQLNLTEKKIDEPQAVDAIEREDKKNAKIEGNNCDI